MNTFNLAVCVSPSLLWPTQGSNIPATDQSSAVPPVVQFILENCVEIFGRDVITILGDPSEIDFASDSESTHESRAHSQSSTDDGIESPEPLSPKVERTSIHLSDTNLYVSSTSVEAERLAVHQKVKSASTPSSPCDSGVPSPNTSPSLKRHDDFTSPFPAAFYEPNSTKEHPTVCRRRSEPFCVPPESLKMRIRGNRKSPRLRRQLSSTTTSAELIEHKQPPQTTASGRRLETAVLRRAHSPQTVNLFPVAPSVTHYQRLNPAPTYLASVSHVQDVKNAPEFKPSLHSEALNNNLDGNVTSSQNSPGARCPSPTPDQVFQVVDRRRQPAAPSYHEHMMRRRDGTNKPAFYQGRETSPAKDPDVTRESISQREFRDQLESRIASRSGSLASSGNGSACRERLDSSGHSEPTTPSSPHEYNWDNSPQDDTSNASNTNASTRRLEHSPFGLNLHHKRAGSEGGMIKKQLIEPVKRGQVVTSSAPLRATVNSQSCFTFTNSGGSNVNSTHSHFPHSELFPHEAQAKSLWGPLTDGVRPSDGIRVPLTGVRATTPPPFRHRRGSQTSSSSSVSSLDDRSSVGADSSVSESKTDVTQIRDIKDLLSQQSQANGLKISAQTAKEIAKVKEPCPREHSGYTAPSHDDIEKIMFTEESYV